MAWANYAARKGSRNQESGRYVRSVTEWKQMTPADGKLTEQSSASLGACANVSSTLLRAVSQGPRLRSAPSSCISITCFATLVATLGKVKLKYYSLRVPPLLPEGAAVNSTHTITASNWRPASRPFEAYYFLCYRRTPKSTYWIII